MINCRGKIFVAGMIRKAFRNQSIRIANLQPTKLSAMSPTLIVYVLLDSTDEAFEANFRYYVREAIAEDDGCSHVILLDPKRVRICPEL